MGCVNQCVASYELNKRRCIGHRECRELGRIPLIRGYQCVKKCPGNQKEILVAKGIIHCQVECNGDFHVKSAADLEVLQDCVTINGSLTIELTNIKGVFHIIYDICIIYLYNTFSRKNCRCLGKCVGQC